VKKARTARLHDILARIDAEGASVQAEIDTAPDHETSRWHRWNTLVSRRKKVWKALARETGAQRSARAAGARVGTVGKKALSARDTQLVSDTLKSRGWTASQRGISKRLSADLLMPLRTVQSHLRKLRTPAR
jgi:hypothetical protein